MFRRGPVLADLEWLFAGRDEPERMQVQLFGGNLCHDEVPMMHRIEGPAEEPDHGALRPQWSLSDKPPLLQGPGGEIA